MARNTRPIEFLDYLPAAFRADEAGDASLLSRFLKAFEVMFEELEAAIEGNPNGDIQLDVQSVSGTTITVAPFNTGPTGFSKGSAITISDQNLRGILTQDIPGGGEITHIHVVGESFLDTIKPGDILELHAGGVPDLFSPETTPPPQFRHRMQEDRDYLEYLASWIGLPLRPDKPAEWNRRFFRTAIPLYPKRGTLPGLDALLRAWLKDDLLETEPPLLIITDLTRSHTDVDAVLQIGERATLGVDTVLGEGPPFFFIVDLVIGPKAQVEDVERAARFLIDTEKPAHTYYQLRVRSHDLKQARTVNVRF